MTALPHQTVVTLRQYIVAIISDSHLNPKITSVSDSLSTPSGCSWPTPIHNSTMSSSLKELGCNGMLSPQVVTKIQIWFFTSISSPRVGSISTKVVAMDAVDMLMRKNINLAKFCRVAEDLEI